jgi:membrane-bound lytic murein transglycosylase D
MTYRTLLPVAAAIGVSISIAGCGRGTRPVQVTVKPPAPAVAEVRPPEPAPVRDPVADLIAESERHFTAGERELGLGHLEQARSSFDLAIEILLKSPAGARTEPRVRKHFDQLVERISAHEIMALAQGDGFVEKKTEPASIDKLLEISTFDPPAPTTATETAVAGDLSQHDIDIPLNRKVLSYIELFQGNLREFITEGLQRGTRYLPMIQDEFREQGLPLDLAYIPLIESAFKNTARSRVSAQGMWQFMSYTGRDHGLTLNWYVDERSDPEKATKAAAQYLKTLGRMFDDDWHLAMASYNGGPGRVQRAVRRSGKDDFWELTATSRYLPRETREYVPMILAAIIIAKNPTQYGFTVEPAMPLAYEKVPVKDPIDLRLVAEWTNVPIDDIEALNPELRRWTTPVRSPNYEIKIPVGTSDAFRVRLTETPAESLNTFQWHSVKRGETLLSISRKLKVRQADLAEANSLTLKSRVQAGQQLIIPRAPTTLLAARPENPAPEVVTADAEPAVAQKQTQKPAPASVSADRAEPQPHRIVHRVKRGDTLSSIARLYNTTITALKSWNERTIRGNRINVGDRLTIFAPRAAN